MAGGVGPGRRGGATDFATSLYIDSWRQKVERMGALSYPGKSQGSIRLYVSIRSDGTLEDVSLLDSSGHPELDQAALTTIRRASPYAQFPPGLKLRMDVLEFRPTLNFRQSSGR